MLYEVRILALLSF